MGSIVLSLASQCTVTQVLSSFAWPKLAVVHPTACWKREISGHKISNFVIRKYPGNCMPVFCSFHCINVATWPHFVARDAGRCSPNQLPLNLNRTRQKSRRGGSNYWWIIISVFVFVFWLYIYVIKIKYDFKLEKINSPFLVLLLIFFLKRSAYLLF